MTDFEAQHVHQADPPLIKPSIWTTELTARLEALAGTMSSLNISVLLSAEFGIDISRNAVIGKLARLGYRQLRPTGVNDTPQQRKSGVVRVRTDRPMKAKPFLARPFVPRVVKCIPRQVPLLDLDDIPEIPSLCRFPDGADPASMTFCALPTVHNSSWCRQHHALVFVPPQHRKDRKPNWRAA